MAEVIILDAHALLAFFEDEPGAVFGRGWGRFDTQ
jgi:hypothetical protein